MAKRRDGHELIPSARRLALALRDMGYDFSAAVADLVDNSIEAHATIVAIDVEYDGDDSWLRIADNGDGMEPPQLKEALRYGSERDYDANDLGKFGLGLKTASLSQCQRLTVASRTNPNRADIAAYCWDLAHIEKTNRWEVLAVNRNALGPPIYAPLKETTGTVVLWQRLDRILGYKHPYGEVARKRLGSICRDLESHLGMVFHRFIIGEARKRKLKLLVNGNVVARWDPFARSEPKTKSLHPIILTLEHEGVTGKVTIEPYVLPHQREFSSPEAHRLASGPLNWNQQQGFYIYRAGRLIQSGGWSRLRTADEHTKLARVALSFSPALDEAFKINVAKMRVSLPPQIRDQVEKAIAPVIKIAQETYRKKSVEATTSASHPRTPTKMPPALSKGRGLPQGSTSQQIAADHLASPDAASLGGFVSDNEDSDLSRLWTIDELQGELERSAEPSEKKILSKVFGRLRDRLAKTGATK